MCQEICNKLIHIGRMWKGLFWGRLRRHGTCAPLMPFFYRFFTYSTGRKSQDAMWTLPFSDSLLPFVGRAKIHYALLKPAVIHSGFHHCEIPPRQHFSSFFEQKVNKVGLQKGHTREDRRASLYNYNLIQFSVSAAQTELLAFLLRISFVHLFLDYVHYTLSVLQHLQKKEKMSIFISIHSLLGVNS